MKKLLLSTLLMPLFILLNAQSWTPIESAAIAGPPIYYNGHGDSWVTTWDSNGDLLIGWGDGTGLTNNYPSYDPDNEGCKTIDPPDEVETLEWLWKAHWCQLDWNQCNSGLEYCAGPITDAGVAVASGPVNDLVNTNLSYHIPTGVPWHNTDGEEQDRNDKPSSLVFYNDTLYAPMHIKTDNGENFELVTGNGYMSYSTDGTNWTDLLETTPWVKDSELDPFRVMMFLNAGQNLSEAPDEYVYALAIGKEFFWTELFVYLARVPKHRMADYDAYEYLDSYDTDGNPVFSTYYSGITPEPVNGLLTVYKGSGMYHPQTNSYIFMSNDLDGGLYLHQAPKPWGPWETVSILLNADPDNLMIPEGWANDGYVPGLIPKDATSNSVYFTISNVGGAPHYQLIIGQVEFELGEMVATHETNFSNDIELFPNPNTGIFTINTNKLASLSGNNLSVEIYTANGVKIRELKNVQIGQNVEIDMSREANGMYICHLKDDQNRRTATAKMSVIK